MLAPQIAVGIARVRHSAGAPPSAISIHALREEGDRVICTIPCRALVISIHALREEGDKKRYPLEMYYTGISIHALREEGDHEYLLF